MFKRILVANRGEIAWRVIKACHKLNIETVAIYSEADKDAPYLKKVTRSICIGPDDDMERRRAAAHDDPAGPDRDRAVAASSRRGRAHRRRG